MLHSRDRNATGSRRRSLVVLLVLVGSLLVLPAAPAGAHATKHSQGPGHFSWDHGHGHGFPGRRDQTAWPIYRNDLGRTGFNPQEHILSTQKVGRLKLAWRFNTLKFSDSSPVVADGVAYFGSDSGYLWAVDARTGAKLWGVPNGTFENTTPAIGRDAVYMQGTNLLRARDRRTGALLWESPLPKGPFSLSSPAVVSPRGHRGREGHGASVAHATVYGAGNDGLYAFDARTGAQLWKFTTTALVGSSPAIRHGVVYISTGATVYAVDARTHEQKWSYTTGAGSGIAQSSLTVSRGVLYTSVGGLLRALDARTGAVLWTAANTGFQASTPGIANGIVYVGSASDNSLHAFDARTGAEKWTFKTDERIGFTSPTIANGVVYTGSYDGRIYALNAQTGAQLWSFTTGGIIEGSPTVVNGMLYIGSNDYFMYAFSLDGHATVTPAAGCEASNGIWLSQFGAVPGICRFAYKPGTTYSGEGNFTLSCSGGGVSFTSAGYDLPLTGCSGTVGIVSINPAGGFGAPGGGSVVAGSVPGETPGACDAACLARSQARIAASLAANPVPGTLPPALP